MKRLASVIALLLIFTTVLASCKTDGTVPVDTVTSDTVSADVPTVIPEENTCVYPLSELAYEELAPTKCELTRISQDEVLQVIAETSLGDVDTAVLLTSDVRFVAAAKTEDGWLEFHEIAFGSYPYSNSITLDTFEGLLGESGVRLYYGVGANAAESVYFTFDGDEVYRLASVDGRAAAAGGMLIDRRMSEDHMSLYRAQDGKLVCYDIYDMLCAIFPDAVNVYARYEPNFIYKTHRGLLMLDIMVSENGQYERYAGWLENDAMVLISEADMELPDYTYTPVDTEISEAGRTWLEGRWKFVLRDPVDPTTLEGDELLTYMDEAYTAGMRIFAVYDIDSGNLFGGRYWGGDMDTYYVGGRCYYDQMNPAFPSLSEWESFMRSILADEIVDGLIARDTFIELDGKLWGQNSTRGTDISIRDIGSRIVSVSEDEIVYARIAEHYTDLETGTFEIVEHEFRYTKCEDGWRWTELHLFY